MPSANSNIQFKYGLKTNYTKIAAKDVNIGANHSDVISIAILFQ